MIDNGLIVTAGTYLTNLAGLQLQSISVANRSTTFSTYWGSYNAKDFGAVGNGLTDDTAAINSCIQAAYRSNVQTCYLPPTGNCYKTTSSLYLADPSFASNISNPTTFSFSLALVGENGGANHEGFGSRLCPNFNNGVALWVGPGQGMMVRGIQIIGPSGSYRRNQNSSGIGVAIAGGNGGASRTLIENVEVDNFYTCFSSGTNYGSLGDSNSWHKPVCENAYQAFNIAAVQNFINDIIEPTVSATIAFNSTENITIVGGNPSASGVSNAFTIGSISAITATTGGSCNNYYCYTFTGVISSPDSYVGTVYNSYMLKTADFGIVPVTMTSWNSSTNTGTFQIWPNWGFYYFQNNANAISVSDLQSEIHAITTIYAAERVTTLSGGAFDWSGGHLENNACTTFIDQKGSGGDYGISVRRLFANYEISQNAYKPANSPTPAQLALFYCQQSFPFIFADIGAAGAITLQDDNFNQYSTGASDPIIIDWLTSNTTHLFVNSYDSHGNAISLFNPTIRVTQQIQAPISGGDNYIYTPALGGGEWSQTPFLPTNAAAGSGHLLDGWAAGLGTVPYVGWRPAPWAHPRLTPSLYATLTGSLPALGHYPVIDGSTIYSVVDWNSSSLDHLFARSAHSFFSYGQNLTTSNISGLSWSYLGQSFVVQLDATSLSWMFNGLNIGLNNGGGVVNYVVTGVYPSLGYITVLNLTNDYGCCPPPTLAGKSGTTYKGSTIYEPRYSFKEY